VFATVGSFEDSVWYLKLYTVCFGTKIVQGSDRLDCEQSCTELSNRNVIVEVLNFASPTSFRDDLRSCCISYCFLFHQLPHKHSLPLFDTFCFTFVAAIPYFRVAFKQGSHVCFIRADARIVMVFRK
jgi:hypothetical protein